MVDDNEAVVGVSRPGDPVPGIWGRRRRLPDRRRGPSQVAHVDGHKIRLSVDEYEDGTPGKLHIRVSKEGSFYRVLLNCLAIAVTIGLQHGVPVLAFVKVFRFKRCDPCGVVTGDDDIKMCTSIIDYIFHWFGIGYLSQEDLESMNVPPTPNDTGHSVFSGDVWGGDGDQDDDSGSEEGEPK